MKWLADENIPLVSVKTLRQTGFDVATISEREPGLEDQLVLDIAHREGRGILTFDRDFGELIFRQRLPSPPAVVYLRFAPTSPSEPAELVLSLFDSVKTIDGRFIILDRDRIRSRALPVN